MIFGAIALLTVLGVIYLVCQFRRFRIVQRAGEKHKVFSWLLASLIPAAIFSTALLNRFAFYIVFIHMAVIWMLCNLAASVIRKCLHREPTRYYAGGAALLITAAVLGSGWYFAHHVYETDYRLETDKDLGGAPLRAAMIADSHLSVTLDGEKFRQKMEEIASKNPDILFISGDFVDDDTKRQDMFEACEALGDMDLKYGIYYVYGNHDLGYYNYRDFTGEELVQALTENNVTLLADETVTIDGRFTVTGRLDHSMERMEAGELPLGEDGLYHILLDHQPTDYDAEAAAGFDLVLCGHTHGGHIFPAGQIGLIISENDALYGHEVRGNTDFILTSGISGWSLPFKTGCISEYCIIDVE
jgi:hypothetical protein